MQINHHIRKQFTQIIKTMLAKSTFSKTVLYMLMYANCPELFQTAPLSRLIYEKQFHSENALSGDCGDQLFLEG